MPEYKDHNIEITQRYEFLVSGPGIVEGPRLFASYAEATTAIDKAQAAMAKQARSNGTAVKVLSQKGQPATVTGINVATGKLLGLPVDTDRVYPTGAHIEALLAEQLSVAKRMRELEKSLHSFAISAKRTYGRVSASDYDELVEKFVTEATAKQQKADELATQGT